MNIRFSLKTFFVLVTLLAAFCYYWFVLPTVTAKQFVQAIAAGDYAAADELFSNLDDRFIASSAKKYWAFESKAALLPVSLPQLLSGRRQVHLKLDYFHLDENVNTLADIRATPLGLKSPVISQVNSAVIIERGSSALPLR
jgi:hypothetical protein